MGFRFQRIQGLGLQGVGPFRGYDEKGSDVHEFIPCHLLRSRSLLPRRSP